MDLTAQNSLKASACLGFSQLDFFALVEKLQIRIEVANESALISTVHERFLHLVKHSFLNLDHGCNFLVHFVLQLPVFERFPGLKGFLCQKLFMGLGLILSQIDEFSHYLSLVLDSILPASQEDLFVHPSLLRNSLTQD